MLPSLGGPSNVVDATASVGVSDCNDGVLCELSLVVLYEGQHLWREMIDRLEAAGFILWGLQPGFMDQRGRNLQCDAIFFREH